MNRKLVLLFVLSLTFLNACGGGGSSTAGGGGTGPQPIAVNFQSLPPQSMMTGSNYGVSATVTNDSANAGVNWTCTPTAACGSFNPASTPSGNTTTYTAPSTVPSGGKVTLIATSVTDSTKNAQAQVTITAPAPPPIAVSISTTPTPPATMSVSTTAQASTAQIAATVTNDSANAGVNWSCTPTPSCGSSSSFSPNPASSGTATTYTAPSSVPTGGTVTLTATSMTDPTKVASTSPVVITGVASNASLKGQYAFIVSAPTGNPVSRGITTWIGSIGLDGAGNVLGGAEDIVAPKYQDPGDTILATGAANSVSTYGVDSTGHGTMVISTLNHETLHVSFVVTSPTHAVIIEKDGEPGSGTMDLQAPASQISGAYSFTMIGIDDTAASNPPQLSYGGVFNVSGSSVTGGTIDVNSAGGMHSETVNPMNSTISTPDANGRGTILSVGTSPNPTRTFIYYVVTPKVLHLTESDGAAFMGGTAYAQGTASTTLSGNYVYQHSGWNPALAIPPTGRTVGAGQFSVASGSTNLSGFSDANTTNPSGTPATTGSAGVAVTGSYTVSSTESATINLTLSDASGSSTYNMYMVDPTLNLLDPNNTTGGGGAVLLHTGTLVNGTGIVIPQQTAGTFLGNYALNLNNSIANASSSTPSELDLVGVVSGDGNAHFGGAAPLGLADYDAVTALDSPPAIVGAPLSGGFQIDQGHAGRATGTFTVGVPAGWPTPYPFIPGATTPVSLSVAIYQVSSRESFIVETDTQANVSGYLVQQQLP